MNKQLTAFLIITSICMLALKDSATFIHTLLHYIPDNPWHQHAPLTHQHRINPMEIHKYLQQKHTHADGHEHSYAHVHDIADHFHSDKNNEPDTSLPAINLSLKVDLFIQSDPDFSILQTIDLSTIKHYSLYIFSGLTHYLSPAFQPPQLV